MLEVAAEAGIACDVRDLSLTDFYNADEVFVTGTMGGLAPVTAIDGRAIGDGKPGPVTGRLLDCSRTWSPGPGRLWCDARAAGTLSLMTEAVAVPAISLPGGVEMPMIGFGTWQLRGRAGRQAVLAALQAGYRHIDTATMYGNEADVGHALADSGVDRDAVFLTTKLPSGRAGQERAPWPRACGHSAPTTWTCGWCTRRRPGASCATSGRSSWRCGTRAGPARWG